MIYLPFLALVALAARFYPKKFDIGIGPEPLINNVYHKRALSRYGYSAETFVDSVYFITSDFDKRFFVDNIWIDYLIRNVSFYIFLYSVFNYRCVYVYFNGGALYRSFLLWRFEPYLYKLAGVKVVVMPYGGDVQVLTRSPNLVFRHAMIQDYPNHRNAYVKIQSRIRLWTAGASAVLAGCEWVDYLYHWDRLMVAHFSIDLEAQEITHNDTIKVGKGRAAAFKILHAPNHRSIKGTQFVLDAVEELKREGHEIELMLAEKKSNSEILGMICAADLVIDQLVIGWYAMFAIESMVRSKPVICHLREDLINLYRFDGLIEKDEPPLIRADFSNVKSVIRQCITGEIDIEEHGKKGYAYVQKLHSTEAVGKIFDEINREIGVRPGGVPAG